jgi:hypothetical protein
MTNTVNNAGEGSRAGRPLFSTACLYATVMFATPNLAHALGDQIQETAP